MPDIERNDQLYPHEQADGPVTPEQLAAHVDEHPEMYHPALVPHIQRNLGAAAANRQVVGVEWDDELDDLVDVDVPAEEIDLGDNMPEIPMEVRAVDVARNAHPRSVMYYDDEVEEMEEEPRRSQSAIIMDALADAGRNEKKLQALNFGEKEMEALRSSGYNVSIILDKSAAFSGLSQEQWKEVAKQCLQENRLHGIGVNAVVTNYRKIEHLTGMTDSEIIDSMSGECAAGMLAYYNDLTPEQLEPIVAKAIKGGFAFSIMQNISVLRRVGDPTEFVADNIDAFLSAKMKLPFEVLDELDNEKIVRAANNLMLGDGEEGMLSTDDGMGMLMECIAKAPREVWPQWVVDAEDALGELPDANTMEYFWLNHDGDVTEAKPAVAWLRAQIRGGDISLEAEKMMMGPADDGKDIRSLLRAVFMKETGFNADTVYTRGSDYGLVRAMVRHSELAPELLEIDECYVPRRYEIATRNSKDIEIADDAVNQYGKLAGRIYEAATVARGYDSANGLAGRGNQFTERFASLRDDIDDQIKQLHSELGKNEQKNAFIESQIAELENYRKTMFDNDDKRFVLASPGAVRQAYAALGKYPKLHHQLTVLTFAYALRKHTHLLGQIDERIGNLFDNNKPDIDNLSFVVNFVDNIVNKQTYGEYFNDKKSRSMFRSQTKTTALVREIERTNTYGVKGNTRTLEIMPTRGILMEMSGQMADACWANQYDTIAGEMPNMTTLIFRYRPGTEKQKYVGAAMVIKGQTIDGREAYIVRGLNPTETFINAHDARDFYGAIRDYMLQISEQTGAVPMIVVDERGTACTNRPVIANVLNDKRDSGELEKLSVLGYNTHFNGYDITEKTYRIT